MSVYNSLNTIYMFDIWLINREKKKKNIVLLLQNVIPPGGVLLRHDLQTKLDAITEDTTARFMAKVARDMVQVGWGIWGSWQWLWLFLLVTWCLEHSTLQ